MELSIWYCPHCDMSTQNWRVCQACGTEAVWQKFVKDSMPTMTQVLTKVYGISNRLKVQLALGNTKKAFDVVNELNDYLVSIDVSEELETKTARSGGGPEQAV